MPFRLRLLPLLIAVVACPAAALAQAAQQTADDKEIYAYVLTMDKLHKVMRATRALHQEMLKDPRYKEMARLEAEIKKLEEKEETQDDGLSEADRERLDALREKHEQLEDGTEGPLDNAGTLNEMEAAARKNPALAAALQREGLSPREYAKFWIGFWSAGLAYGF